MNERKSLLAVQLHMWLQQKKCGIYGNRYLGNTEKQKQVILFYMSPHLKVRWGFLVILNIVRYYGGVWKSFCVLVTYNWEPHTFGHTMFYGCFLVNDLLPAILQKKPQWSTYVMLQKNKAWKRSREHSLPAHGASKSLIIHTILHAVRSRAGRVICKVDTIHVFSSSRTRNEKLKVSSYKRCTSSKPLSKSAVN